MSCATAPIHWAPQAHLPRSLRAVVRQRLEQALEDPAARFHLVWPMVLGSPRMASRYPEGITLERLVAEAGRSLATLGCVDPEEAWLQSLKLFPDTAEPGATGWKPHPTWESAAEQVSLRCGVSLLALTGHPLDARYPLAAGVTLFNTALFHECHDALERVWREAEGDLKRGLRGLILMTAGFHHQQEGHRNGMKALWTDALEALSGFQGVLETPWGMIRFERAWEAVILRKAWLETHGAHDDLTPLWSLPRPEWEWMS